MDASSFLFAPSGVARPCEDLGRTETLRDRTLGGRFRLRRVVGRGAGGVVWQADDSVAGDRAAVKLMRIYSDADRTRIRREIATLRWLRLPGVVAYRDDGEELDGLAWCAMDLVRGRPFPGRRRRVSWQELEPVAVAFLESLARLHWAGIAHRDLKPANVLVDFPRSGPPRVTIVDLGLSAQPDPRFGPDLSAPAGFTPRYAAPEQVRGECGDARSDVYAAAVMIREALAAAPRIGGRLGQALAAAAAAHPSRRPASAEEVLHALGRRAIRLHLPHAIGSQRITQAALRQVFSGPERVFHEPSDAAAELHARTGGDRARVANELRMWIRAGIAVPDGRRLRVDRSALDRLRLLPTADGAPPPRQPWGGQSLARAAAAEHRFAVRLVSATPAMIARDAADLAKRLLAVGAIRRAASVTSIGLSAARASGDGAAAARLAAAALHVGLTSNSPPVIAHLLSDVERSAGRMAREAGIVLRAALRVLSGNASEALAMTRCLTGSAHPSIRARLFAVRALAARHVSRERERSVVARAMHALRRDETGVVASLRGWVAYRGGRFRDAERLHLSSIGRGSPPVARLRALLDASQAALDDARLDDARRHAARALRIASSIRSPFHEFRAESLLRCCLYRSGSRCGPDMELVRTIAGADTVAGIGVLIVNECAAAWRWCSRPVLESLLDVAARCGARRLGPPSQALVGAMADSRRIRKARDPDPTATLPPLVRAQVRALRAVPAKRLRGRAEKAPYREVLALRPIAGDRWTSMTLRPGAGGDE